MFSSRIDRSQRILEVSGQRNHPTGPSQCYVWKQLFSLQVQLSLNNLPSYRPYLESNNPQPPRGRMFRAVPTQQEQSQWKGSDESKRCNRQKAKQTLFITKTQCTSEGVPVLGRPSPCTAGSPALTGLYSGQRVAVCFTTPASSAAPGLGQSFVRFLATALQIWTSSRRSGSAQSGNYRHLRGSRTPQPAPPPRPSTSTSAEVEWTNNSVAR